MLPISILHRDVATDVAVGRVERASSRSVLALAATEVPPGSSVSICGYPPFEDAGGKCVSFAATFQATFVLDHGTFELAGHVNRCIFMRDNPFFGMSGGPIVDANGTVVGMQSSVAHPRFNRGADNREFKVENGIGVEAEALRAALAIAAGKLATHTGAA